MTTCQICGVGFEMETTWSLSAIEPSMPDARSLPSQASVERSQRGRPRDLAGKWRWATSSESRRPDISPRQICR